MVFSVVMYGCESWTVKKTEHRRIDAFELWCWRRLLRVPWTARRSNQSILKISPGIPLEGMMLKLKLHYFGHLMQQVDSLEKNSDAGRDWGQEEKGTTEDEMAGLHHRLDEYEFEWTPGVGDGQGGLACCHSWCRKELDTTEWLNWTEPSWWGFSFACGHGVSFFGGIQHSPVNGGSAVSCNFGVLIREDECMSFYSAILRKHTLAK